jgi:hypothetical protein
MSPISLTPIINITYYFFCSRVKEIGNIGIIGKGVEMKRETEVWRSFVAHLPRAVMRRRIEDSSGALGTWDTFLGRDGRCAWIELKYTETVRTKPLLRKGQYAFGLQLERCGVPGCYVVGSGDGKVRIINHLYPGDDWEPWVDEQWPSMERQRIHGLLERLGIGCV